MSIADSGSAWAGVVGRGPEAEAVEGFLTDIAAWNGGATALLIDGEAGLGKSTVWQAAVHLARQRGILTVSCTPAAVEQALSFVALRDLLDGVTSDDLGRLPPPQAQALRSALLLAMADEGVDQGALGVAVTAVLRRWARDRPLLIAIDDSQWLDPPSARTIAFATRRLGDARIGLLLARRTGEVAPLFDELASAPDRQARRLRLGPINFGGLHRILTSRTGHRFPRPLVARIETSSGGNPMSAIEIGRALIDSGVTTLEPDQPLPVPERLRDLLDARLARLSPASRDALLLASLLSHPTVALVADASLDGSSALAGLDEAEAAGIVEINRATVRLTHPLFGSVIQSSLSQGGRRSLHRRLGAVLPDGEERAVHLALAATEPDAELAERLETTGRQTARRGAPDLGAGLLARARSLTPPDRLEDLARLVTLEAEARFEAGDLEGGRDVLEDARSWIPAGRPRAEALLLLGTIVWYLDGPGASGPLEQALLDAEDDRALRGRIHGRLALFLNDTTTAQAHGRAAVELIDPVADPSGAAFARFSSFFAEVLSGAPPDLAAFETALVLDMALSVWEVSTIPGLWWKYTGQFELARQRLELHLQWARDSGDESSDADLYAHVAELALYAGDWSAAVTAAERAIEAAEQMGQRLPNTADRALALACALTGRPDEAISMAEAGIAAAREVEPQLEAMYLDVLATARATVADHAGVIEALDRQLVVLDGMGVREPLRYRTEGDHIESLVAIGTLDRAEALIERLEARQDVIPRHWIAAALARSRALVREARGDPAGAVEALTAFVDASEGDHPGSTGQGGVEPFAAARTLLVLGQLERRQGHRRAAGLRLAAAATIFVALPAPAWAAQARREIDRLGRRRSATNQLTPAEASVAELVAGGMTNRAAAERLVLSPKTVEAHLARAYAKLGIRSRAELGAWLAAGRDPRPPEADDPTL